MYITRDRYNLDRGFVYSPPPRIAICLCLDTSASMDGSPIDELNIGLKTFYEDIRQNPVASASADIAIVTFGCYGTRCMQEFSGVGVDLLPPCLMADGMTPMGEAVNLAIDILETRVEAYEEVGIQYDYRPWLVLMTDGMPNGNSCELERAKRRVQEKVLRDRLVVFSFGVGNNADMETLYQFSPKRRPLRLKGLRFRQFFQWLCQSIARTSSTSPDNIVKLDDVSSWGYL